MAEPNHNHVGRKVLAISTVHAKVASSLSKSTTEDVAHERDRKVRVGLNHRHAAPAGTQYGFVANMLPVAFEMAPLGQGQSSLLLGLLDGRLLGGRLLGCGLGRGGLLGRRLLDGCGLLLGRSLLGGHASETHLRTGRASGARSDTVHTGPGRGQPAGSLAGRVQNGTNCMIFLVPFH